MQTPNDFQRNQHALTVKNERKRNITMTSAQIAQQVEEYIRSGGKIEMLPGFENKEPKYRIDDAGFYDRYAS